MFLIQSGNFLRCTWILFSIFLIPLHRTWIYAGEKKKLIHCQTTFETKQMQHKAVTLVRVNHQRIILLSSLLTSPCPSNCRGKLNLNAPFFVHIRARDKMHLPLVKHSFCVSTRFEKCLTDWSHFLSAHVYTWFNYFGCPYRGKVTKKMIEIIQKRK